MAPARFSSDRLLPLLRQRKCWRAQINLMRVPGIICLDVGLIALCSCRVQGTLRKPHRRHSFSSRTAVITYVPSCGLAPPLVKRREPLGGMVGCGMVWRRAYDRGRSTFGPKHFRLADLLNPLVGSGGRNLTLKLNDFRDGLWRG